MKEMFLVVVLFISFKNNKFLLTTTEYWRDTAVDPNIY
jgi:hypothetical protein